MLFLLTLIFSFTPTGKFVEVIIPQIHILLPLSFSLIILAIGKKISTKKKEKITSDYLQNRIIGYLKKLIESYGLRKRELEERFLYNMGSLCSYFKRRTSEPTRLGKFTYGSYERLFTVMRNALKEVLEEYPELKKFDLFYHLARNEKIDIYKLIEFLSKESEIPIHRKYKRLTRKSLKRLRKLLEYVK